MLPSLPDDDILLNIPHLRGYHELVHDAGAQLRGQEPQANDQSFRAAQFPDLADQNQIDQRAIDRGSKNPEPQVHANRMLLDIDEGVPEPMDVGGSRNLVEGFNYTGDPAAAPELEPSKKMCTIDRSLANRLYVAVTMDVLQVSQVHGVLRQLLDMAGKSDAPEFRIAPVVSCGRHVRKGPLRRSSSGAPPGEDQAVNFPCFEHLELHGFRRRGKGSRHAIAGNIVREPVKGADETVITQLAAGGRPQRGTHVRAHRLGHADSAFTVTPGNDVLT